jgi:hypothetical protein
MSNNHLVKYLAQERGISIKEARKICERKKKFRRYFKEEVNEDGDYREEWSESKDSYCLQK